jgi:hypothetical protein
LNEHILDYLGGVTLRQLVDAQKAKATDAAPVQDMRESMPKRDRTAVSA